MSISTKLFRLNDGSWLTDKGLESHLRESGASDCDVLYIHSALDFGLPNPTIKPKSLLGHILDTIERLDVPTICMPTYTFSFPNGKTYNPMTSKSKMGALNEFFRKQEGVIRSLDPLMSVALKGEDKRLVTEVGSHSISENSTFDMIHHTEGVKFLMLGPRIGFCLTYMHYLEWLFSVDYRYIRAFKGCVEEADGVKTVEQDLFVRYSGVTANTKSYEYEDMMVEAKDAFREQIGNGYISVVSEKAATEWYRRCLCIDPHFFVDIDYSKKDKTFKLSSEMIAL